VPKLERIQIELTSRCNERCIHCYIPKNDGNQDMDSGLLWSILDQCWGMGLEQIVFSGGEPMLHPDFWKIIEHEIWNNCKVRVFSNLTLLDDNLADELKKWNVHEVQASLYSVIPAIHDAVTKLPGSCEKTKRGIEMLAGKGVPVFVSCPITKINKGSYPDVLSFARQLKLRSVPGDLIMAQSNRNSGNLEYRLNIVEAMQVIQDVLDNDTAYDAERFSPEYHNPDTIPRCVQNVCESMICINAKGEVVPSPEWHYVLGDLNKQTLKDIWGKSSRLKRVQSISLEDFPKCQSCHNIVFCGMGLGLNANENKVGDPFVIPTHICELAEATRKLVHSHRSKQKETA